MGKISGDIITNARIACALCIHAPLVTPQTSSSSSSAFAKTMQSMSMSERNPAKQEHKSTKIINYLIRRQKAHNRKRVKCEQKYE